MPREGSKFRAVSSSDSVHELRALKRYWEGMEQADTEEEIEIDRNAVAAALEKLRQHPEPEARFMRTSSGKVPAYNVQTAVDAEHALIVTHQVSDEASDTSRFYFGAGLGANNEVRMAPNYP